MKSPDLLRPGSPRGRACPGCGIPATCVCECPVCVEARAGDPPGHLKSIAMRVAEDIRFCPKRELIIEYLRHAARMGDPWATSGEIACACWEIVTGNTDKILLRLEKAGVVERGAGCITRWRLKEKK